MEKEQNKEIEKFLIDRRTFVKIVGTTGAAIAFGGVGLSRFIESAKAIDGLAKYVDPLVIPPVLTPNTTRFRGKDYYEIPIVMGTTHKFHRDLPATKTYSYFGTPPAGGFHYLGPTIVANKGRPVSIKFTNRLPRGIHIFNNAIDTTIMGSKDENGRPWIEENRVCVHLHGGKVLPKDDGGPRDWFSPVGSQQANPYPDSATRGIRSSYTYEYQNDQQATLLWYHDHAWAITRFNPIAGLAAGYILRDNLENLLIRTGSLPGGKYEVPIVLQDKLIDLETGSMIYPIAESPGSVHPIWIPEYFGDLPVVNGKIYPYHTVEPRRYRLRFLNGSNARFYNIYFDGGSGPIPFYVIGSEQGFLPFPARKNKLLIAPGERFDVLINFSGLTGNILLKNDANAPYPSGSEGFFDEIMQFRIGTSPRNDIAEVDKTPVENITLPSIPSIVAPNTPWREIVIEEIEDPVTGDPQEALLDGWHFVDSVNNDNLFEETAGSIKVWQFINTTGDAHPMHTHLVPFKILNRQAFNVVEFKTAWDAWIAGNRVGPRPSVNSYLIGVSRNPDSEETGWKDTAKSYPGEVLRIVTKFDLPAGTGPGKYKYVCHCHILEHEENDMMFQFVVVKN